MIIKLNRIRYSIISLALLLPVFAFADVEEVPNLGNGDYGLNKAKHVTTESTSIADAIGQVIGFLLEFIGGLSVLVIVIAGIMYITSGGDEGKVDTAKKWLTYAIVGLVISLLAWVIVNTVIGAI